MCAQAASPEHTTTILREIIKELPAEERVLAGRGLMLGLVVDPNKPEYERGDFLVRNVMGFDQRVVHVARVARGKAQPPLPRDLAAAREQLTEALALGKRTGALTAAALCLVSSSAT